MPHVPTACARLLSRFRSVIAYKSIVNDTVCSHDIRDPGSNPVMQLAGRPRTPSQGSQPDTLRLCRSHSVINGAFRDRGGGGRAAGHKDRGDTTRVPRLQSRGPSALRGCRSSLSPPEQLRLSLVALRLTAKHSSTNAHRTCPQFHTCNTCQLDWSGSAQHETNKFPYIDTMESFQPHVQGRCKLVLGCQRPVLATSRHVHAQVVAVSIIQPRGTDPCNSSHPRCALLR